MDRIDHLYFIDRKRVQMPDVLQLRLNRLERPTPLPDTIIDKIRDFDPHVINEYPAYGSFLNRVAGFYGVAPACVVLGQGIEEHIRTLLSVMLRPGEAVAYPWPTCKMFDIYCQAFGLRSIRVDTHPFHRWSLSEFLSVMQTVYLNEVPRMLILPNPGQPDDTYFDRADMEAIADWCAEHMMILAVDEAYHGFGADSSLGLVESHRNVVVLRTFSKALGAAGIRIGAAIAGPAIRQPMEAVRLSGELSSLSMHAACVIMDHPIEMRDWIDEIVAGRDWLADAVGGMGFAVGGAKTNHVTIGFKHASLMWQIAEDLEADGILVNWRLPGRYQSTMMVTAGTVDQMKRFFTAFEDSVHA